MSRLFQKTLTLAFVLLGFASTASAKPCELEQDEFGRLFGDCDLSMWTDELIVRIDPIVFPLPNLTPTAASSTYSSGVIDFDTTIDNNGPRDAGQFDVSAMMHVYEVIDDDGDTFADRESYLISYNAITTVAALGAGQSTAVGVLQIVPPTNSTLRIDLFINADSNYSGSLGRIGEVWEFNERDQRLQYSCWFYGDEPLYQGQTENRIPLCR